MPRKDQDWEDFDDFDFDADDEGDEEDGSNIWTVEQWEAELQERDERHRKLAELLDKYGHDEAGFRKAMAELGLGAIFEELDRLAAEQENQPGVEDEEEDHEEQIDKILRASRYATEDFEKANFRHPLGNAVYELTLMVLKSLEGHDEIDSRAHPLVVFSGAFLDAMDSLAGSGYMREWDDDFHLSTPRNLKIAELKRAVKNLVKGLNELENVERQNLLVPEICAPIREHAVELLDEVRLELRRLGWK
ncbi:MAG: hypothetical protein ONB44_22640 [candidate division KSB1 bacterium]|nr:hypothetical protein [candidate division KSB1 bacterium]MDZ7304937.1 hypothetical protein [candidate division KSB1 bacterium]MDZ7311655.1 hypothetical protein [candidate division KSB1 bacterium]